MIFHEISRLNSDDSFHDYRKNYCHDVKHPEEQTATRRRKISQVSHKLNNDEEVKMLTKRKSTESIEIGMEMKKFRKEYVELFHSGKKKRNATLKKWIQEIVKHCIGGEFTVGHMEIHSEKQLENDIQTTALSLFGKMTEKDIKNFSKAEACQMLMKNMLSKRQYNGIRKESNLKVHRFYPCYSSVSDYKAQLKKEWATGIYLAFGRTKIDFKKIQTYRN